ncbi:MAG: hypothetical protein HRU15_11750 [Planctomycetes bacterium]|nr:hypothetical protein [Planctomycetota bacterium]
MRLIHAVLCITVLFFHYNNTAIAAEKVLYDFNTPNDKSLNWVKGYKDNPELEVVGETTSNNFKLKMTLKGGNWPGFTLPVPKNWKGHQAFVFEAYSAGPVYLNVRIDDPGSKDFNSRYSHVFKLKAGRNLCQIETANIAEKLDIQKIKAAIIFCNKPPEGLVVHIDNIVLGDLRGEEVPFIPYAERKDLQPKFDVVTPHFPMAKNLAAGPIKTFYLTSITEGREVVEMAQRMDVDASVQHWDPSYGKNTWGMGDFYGKRGHKTDYVLMQEYLASSMQGPEKFESMMLFTPQGWERFGKSAQDAIVKRVREDGVGLVFVFPFPGVEKTAWPKNLRDINALIDSDSDYPNSSGYVKYARSGRVKGETFSVVGDHPITRGVPLDALPTEHMQYQKYKLAPDAQVLIKSKSGDPILAVRKVGKGRVATFAWRSSALTPKLARAGGADPLRSYRYWEVVYSLMNRASMWVAGRDFTTGTAEVLKDDSEHNLQATVYKNAEGKITDWALKFTPPGNSTVKHLSLSSADFINYGEKITGKLAFDDVLKELRQKHPAATVRISVNEEKLLRHRSLVNTQEKLSAITSDVNIDFSSEKVSQIMAVLHAEIRDGDQLLAQGKKEIIVTPQGPLWDDYEILMWHVGGLPFMRELEDKLVTQFGSTGIMETRWQDAGLRMRYARAGLRLMVHDLARPQLHLREFSNISTKYNKTNDKKLLIRNPSYADSTFLSKERKRVTDAVQELKRFHPTNYILCDEPSLTNYRFDFDFDFHPENIQRFKAALKKKFTSIENLNSCLATNYESFDKVYPVLTAQAKKNKQWPLWNEWRQHNDDIVADGYKMYKEAVQAADPKGTISVSGTQIATPFDGFDWAKLSPHFGSMQGYGYGDQERKRMSFNDTAMVNAVPAGYGRAGRAVDFQIWDSVTNHGGGHVLFWWIAFRNPDLTFCQSAYDYMKLFKEMHGGIGRQFLLAKRELSPIAMVYSMNSLRAARALGKDYHKAADTCSEHLVALGYDPMYVSEEQIVAGDLQSRGFKAVFLPSSHSLGQGKNNGALDTLAALRAYADKGGLVFHRENEVVDEFMLNKKSDLLNFSTHYSDVDAKVAAALAKVTVPAVSLGGNSEAVLKKMKLKVHNVNGHKDARIVTVLRPPVGVKEVLGGDGVVHMVPDTEGGKKIEPMKLNLSELKAQHVYHMRSGKKVALSDNTVNIDMLAGDGVPFALLPYEISGLDLKISTTGSGDIQVNWQLQGSTSYAAHAVRISVLENGKEDPVLSCNATTEEIGSGSQIIRLAQEDAGRSLRVVVKDILTGVRSMSQAYKQ